MSEVFLPVLPDTSHRIYLLNEVFLGRTPHCFQNFGATEPPGFLYFCGYAWPTEEVGSGFANSWATREVIKPLLKWQRRCSIAHR